MRIVCLNPAKGGIHSVCILRKMHTSSLNTDATKISISSWSTRSRRKILVSVVGIAVLSSTAVSRPRVDHCELIYLPAYGGFKAGRTPYSIKLPS
jgi:hypothetical protein